MNHFSTQSLISLCCIIFSISCFLRITPYGILKKLSAPIQTGRVWELAHSDILKLFILLSLHEHSLPHSLLLYIMFYISQFCANFIGVCCPVGFSGGTSGKEPACQCRRHREVGLFPGYGRSPEGRHDHPLQYSCLENPMDRGAWKPTIHTGSQSRSGSTHVHT